MRSDVLLPGFRSRADADSSAGVLAFLWKLWQAPVGTLAELATVKDEGEGVEPPTDLSKPAVETGTVLFRQGGSGQAPAQQGGVAEVRQKRRIRSSARVWTRADGFTMSGPRMV